MLEHRTLTEAFIQENPIDVVFRRRSRVQTNEGGWSLGPEVNQPAQTARLVQSGRVGAAGTRHTPDGRLRDATATLLLLPGANVEIGDLVEIPPQAAGDPGLVGDWEVVDIGGRWAMNVEIVKHGG